jgi:hypothetical protein
MTGDSMKWGGPRSGGPGPASCWSAASYCLTCTTLVSVPAKPSASVTVSVTV